MDNRKPVKIVANRRQFLCDTFSVATSFTIGGAFAALTGRLAHGESQLSFKRKMVEEDLVESEGSNLGRKIVVTTSRVTPGKSISMYTKKLT